MSKDDNTDSKPDFTNPWGKKETDPDKNDNQQFPGGGNFFKNGMNFPFVFLIIAIVLMLVMNLFQVQPTGNEISYREFLQRIESGEIRLVEISQQMLRGSSRRPQTQTNVLNQTSVSWEFYASRIPNHSDAELIALMRENDVEFSGMFPEERPFLSLLLSWIIPIAILLIFWRIMFSRLGNMGGAGGLMNFGKNNAKVAVEGDTGVKFTDVAGADESKAELEEVVDFLKKPERYLAIGGKIPKGVMLIGPPGTGKTLLARAVAGEAGVPFFRMSGSDFVEMFVGVGASRVRDLFKQAREKAPSIIFIDELDAIGKSRSRMSTNDEREQTLNQLLVEMDGFDARSGVIVLAASNRPETLDPALMRPGRFDRQVLVDKPDLDGRLAILEIHSKTVKLGGDVDLARIARSTAGLAGADLANIINESALLAVRFDREVVMQEDLEEAIEKIMAGLQKKNRAINPELRRRIAYHEVGHALVAHYTKGSDPVEKISIVPRGYGALGYTMQVPIEDRFLMTELDLIGKVDVLLGGRAAEKVVYGDISTGASNDLSKCGDIVRKMITEYGMSDKFHNVYLPKGGGGTYLDSEVTLSSREYSENTQQYIDEETARVMDERYRYVMGFLEERRDLLDKVTDHLLEHEVLSRNEFIAVLGEEPEERHPLDKKPEDDASGPEKPSGDA
ncbi:ATP-dependent zinc metalloprotease FtsH [Spirochaeta dissipatitropha]